MVDNPEFSGCSDLRSSKSAWRVGCALGYNRGYAYEVIPTYPIFEEILVEYILDIWGMKRKENIIKKEGSGPARNKRKRRKEKDNMETNKKASMQTL